MKLRNRHVLLTDLLLIPISVLASYILRLEFFEVFDNYVYSLLWMTGLALVIKPIVYYLFGLYRRMWAYASVPELKLIILAVTTASIVLAIPMLFILNGNVFYAFPRSVLIIDWVISILLVGGQRLSFRVFSERKSKSRTEKRTEPNKKVLIIGAGDAGAMVVKELQRNPQLNMRPIGFLDDNEEKKGKTIYGVPVLGNLTMLPKILPFRRVDEVIIAIPSAPGKIIREVANLCRKHSVAFRTMPGLYELLGGMVNISRLREVDITDLLRRQPAHIDDDRVGSILKNKIVLVTGAGGSIGSELCRQIARWQPKTLIMLGHGENAIFEAYLEINGQFPALDIQTVIADIRDYDRLKRIFSEKKPEVVFHAAAHKHVPLMENNIDECVLNNVEGTKNLLEICLAADVEHFVLISTDKAILPVNVMGATKRMAEMMTIDSAKSSGKPYSVVRFGNVLGSRGSVVPLFKRQIAKGGPITITHPDMKRYFMTIPEAVYLVLQTAGLGKGGETFILNMGEQVRIVDLAEDLIRLSGLEPGRDIEISFTGVREGEKLSEDLWNYGREFHETAHPDVFYEEGQDQLAGKALQDAVNKLLELAHDGKTDEILTMLEQIIPGASVRNSQSINITAIDS
ncbi:MAG: Putative polysaccharide biosynthesis protein [Anaerolinea thermophila]|uniref:Putative polysaccharide biosynthesis protein n=1 Tax=Anaerolinea thermophila TaxID=167964 RepID=A0A124FN21_9CHLR|nr:MAG: Putative polysaccharide biosynthesis protein [Anaerolinea thermophila]